MTREMLEKHGVRVTAFECPRTDIPSEAARQQQDCEYKCDYPPCWYSCWYGGCKDDVYLEDSLYTQRFSFNYQRYE
jgi:hypothetical protein